MHDSHLVNVLGADALAVAELLDAAVTGVAGTSRSGAAAMAVLLQSGPLTVTELGGRIGLSQPAAARMVDALQAAALVERRPGTGRKVPVALTGSGRRSAKRVLDVRAELLLGLVEGLDARDKEQLSRLLGRVLANVYQRMPSAERICRLCDRRACVARAPRCPVGVAAGEPPGV